MLKILKGIKQNKFWQKLTEEVLVVPLLLAFCIDFLIALSFSGGLVLFVKTGRGGEDDGETE